MDNNASERAIRGFCIGKKNWEMIDTINGATSSAIIYSIAETAKANNLKPYEYFEYLLTQIPAHMDDTDRSFLEDLLPWSPKLPEYIRKQKDRGQRSFKSQGTWVGAFTKDLAIPIVAFANADGGDIAIGITDKTKRIEGIDFETKKLNELLRVPFDFCNPTIKVGIEKVPCVDEKGRENHVLVMHIEASPQVHANQADDVFLRVGDKSKLQTFEERLQLNYDKGERYFEDKTVHDATIDDIDMDFVKEYTDKIDYGKSPLEYLKENRGFIKEKDGEIQISTAAILLFGKNPQNFFPRARIRFIRYEGTEEKFGTEMNVIKDVIFEGTLLNMINEAIAYLDTQVKEKTYLGPDGTFVTDEEYPKFVRQELIVNAVTHRAYSITGTDIQIKMFDDHIVVESPGKLPGLVRADNIRFTHFSRNPKIAEFLKNYKFVKEFGEGVNRMCNELEQVGLKDPVYHTNAFMLQAVIYNSKVGKTIVEKTADSLKKLAVAVNKSLIDYQKPAIGEEKSAIDDKKSAVDKYVFIE